jgi:lactam utilization protein B
MQHSSEEFEQAVHDWYDEYDQLVGRYLREQALTRDRQGDDDSYSDRDYDDYGQLLRRRADEAERRRLASSAKHDS